MPISQSMRIPAVPGIYVFRRGKTAIYIGKAANLKKRLSSYFRKNVGEKVRQMLREATNLDWTETSSEVEAFLKEAELVKKHRPKYNVVLRDDKNYFYVGITKEEFPRIFVTHRPSQIKSFRYVGPFTNGAAIKTTLKLLRRVFPYCTCKKSHKRKCLNAQIERCLGYCCLLGSQNKWSEGQILEYNGNIKNIIAVLSGRQKKIIQQIKREMLESSKLQDFERAAKLRDQLSGLENIFSHRLFLADHGGQTSLAPWERIEREIKILAGSKKSISRVEGYDISNISGQEATGSMAVFIDGLPVKSEYRKFRIKTVRGISDVDMLREVIGRRLRHQEWSYPDLILIDGGKTQLNAAQAVLRFLIHDSKFIIPVFALAKREEELYLPGRKFPLPLKNLPQAMAQFLQRVRDESHRFARVYHHKLRRRHFNEE